MCTVVVDGGPAVVEGVEVGTVLLPVVAVVPVCLFGFFVFLSLQEFERSSSLPVLRPPHNETAFSGLKLPLRVPRDR